MSDKSADYKSQVDHDVSFSFKGTSEGHANGDSQNVYISLNTVWNRSKIIAPVHLHYIDIKTKSDIQLYAYVVMAMHWRHVTYVMRWHIITNLFTYFVSFIW